MVGFTLFTTTLLSFLSISLQSAPKCGQSNHCDRGFVIEGAPTCAKEFPFFAALVRPTRGRRQLKPFCGASIITSKFLLTAAHCFKYSPGAPLLTANQVRVYPGYDDRSVELPLYYLVKRIEVHEDWLENTGKWNRGNDISLLELNEAMQFTDTISSVCLPNPDQFYLIEEERKVRMAGFGSTKHFQDVIPQLLQKGDFQMINCTAESPNNICADEVEDGRVVSSTCRGDSGGGLVGLDSGHLYLVGVVSWGRRCGDTDFTTRYVNIFNHLPWINNRICLTEAGNLCILPYQFELIEHTQCEPSDMKSKATCPTKVDQRGQGYEWEPCSKQCPGFKQPVNGGFGEWSDWTNCSKGGIRYRDRDCDSPVAKFGGIECRDDLFEEKEKCNVEDSVKEDTSLKEDTSSVLEPDDNLQCRGVGEQCFNVEYLRSQKKCLNLVKIHDDIFLESDESQFETIRVKTCRNEPYGICCVIDTPVKNGYYLIQSSGGAAQHQASRMGNYTHTGDIVEGYPVYENDGQYLYVDLDGYWTVGPNTSATGGGLYHKDRQPTPNNPPLVGWVYTNNGAWHNDNTLTVTHIGGDKPQPVFYRVSSSGDTAKRWPNQMTDYYPTGDTVNGFPVFRRRWSYMYVSTLGKWMIGPTAGEARGWMQHLKKKTSTPPTTGWKYVNGTAWIVDNSLTVAAVHL